MNKKTILIADDSFVMRLKVQDELEKVGDIHILTAKDGLEATEALKNTSVDGLILDLLMPNMDGYGVLKAIRKMNMNIPIIVLTADIQPTTKNKCIELGAKTVLHKPFNSKELSNSIRNTFNINIAP